MRQKKACDEKRKKIYLWMESVIVVLIAGIIVLSAGVVGTYSYVENRKARENETIREELQQKLEGYRQKIRRKKIIQDGTRAKENLNVREKIAAFGFEVKETFIDTQIYDAEMEKKYKNAYYEVISNQIPLESDSYDKIYFIDYFTMFGREKSYTFIEEVLKCRTKYSFYDMDGDGLPELAMDIYDVTGVIMNVCILKYNLEEDRVSVYKWQECGLFKEYCLLGANQMLYRESGQDWFDLGWVVYAYEIWGEDGQCEKKIVFDAHCDINGRKIYRVSIKDGGKAGYVTERINEKTWNRFVDTLTIMAGKNALKMCSFNEAFGEAFSYDTTKKERYVNEKTYEEIKDNIDKMDFQHEYFGESEKNNLYKEKFSKLLKGEIPFVTKEYEKVYLFEYGLFQEDVVKSATGKLQTGQDILDKYRYMLINVDGFDGPELCIKLPEYSAYYIMKYEEKTNRILLMDEYNGGDIQGDYCFLGIRLAELKYDKINEFQVLNNGKVEEAVRFSKQRHKNAKTGSWEMWYLVDLPRARLSGESTNQRIPGQSDKNGFGIDFMFRVTQQQYEELFEYCNEKMKKAEEEEDKSTFSYEELFGHDEGNKESTMAKQYDMTVEESAELVLKTLCPEEENFAACVAHYSKKDKKKMIVPVALKYPIFEFKNCVEGNSRFWVTQVCLESQTADGKYDIFSCNRWRFMDDLKIFVYQGHFAVDKEKGKVIKERFAHPVSNEWIYNMEYQEILEEKVYNFGI